jgi:hypothetical protein
VRWSLKLKGRVVARGKARARKGQVKIPVGKISRLKAGRYVLKVGGRRGAVFVIR